MNPMAATRDRLKINSLPTKRELPNSLIDNHALFCFPHFQIRLGENKDLLMSSKGCLFQKFNEHSQKGKV